MAIETSNLNTTSSMKKASSVLGKKCEETKANMKKLMANLGVKEYKTVKMLIPAIPGSKDDVVTVGLNGVMFYFKRGESIDVPECVLEVLKNCKYV